MSTRLHDALMTLAGINNETSDEIEALSDALDSQDAALLLLDLASIALRDNDAKRAVWRSSVRVSVDADDEINGPFVA